MVNLSLFTFMGVELGSQLCKRDIEFGGNELRAKRPKFSFINAKDGYLSLLHMIAS